MKIDVAVPDGRSGAWSVQTMVLSDADVALENMRSMMRGRSYARCEAGVYKKLCHDRRGVVMSNTPMEVRTNMAFIREARGNVHINGLGLGMVLTAILAKPEVESITVVEIEQDVISLVLPTFSDQIDAGRLKIIHDDCYSYTPPKAERFDSVWHDVWDEICEDNKPKMTALKRKFGRRTKWQGCWSEDVLRYAR